jgi:hypothetical protein
MSSLPTGWCTKQVSSTRRFLLSNYDLCEGEIDFPALARILKRRQYKGWICVDHHYARTRQPTVQFWPLHEVHQEYFGADLLVTRGPHGRTHR